MKIYTYKGRKFVGLEEHPVTDEQDLVCREVIGFGSITSKASSAFEGATPLCSKQHLGCTAIISRKELIPTQEEFK